MWSKIVGFYSKAIMTFDLPNERVISSAEEQLMSKKFGAKTIESKNLFLLFFITIGLPKSPKKPIFFFDS